MQKTALVLATNTFPLDPMSGERSFIQPELDVLKQAFDSVLVVPRVRVPASQATAYRDEVDLTLADRIHSPRLERGWAGITLGAFWRELPSGLDRAGAFGARSDLQWAATAALTRRWAMERFSSESRVLFYTYWRTGLTLGMAQASKRRRRWRAVTRVHGVDLFAHRRPHGYQPYSPSIYRELDRTYAVAEHAKGYLGSLGVDTSSVRVARLGLPDPGVQSLPSTDGVLRVVSCAYAISLKRLPLIARCLAQWCSQDSTRRVHWTHIGGGPDLANVRAELEGCPGGLTSTLLGSVPPEQVVPTYQSQPCDLFIHLSSTEGLPVAVQEACAVGIPVVATDVGGTREAVGEENGRLLPANPTEDEVLEALTWFHQLSPDRRHRLRAGSRRVWASRFDARENSQRFASDLLGLVET